MDEEEKKQWLNVIRTINSRDYKSSYKKIEIEDREKLFSIFDIMSNSQNGDLTSNIDNSLDIISDIIKKNRTSNGNISNWSYINDNIVPTLVKKMLFFVCSYSKIKEIEANRDNKGKFVYKKVKITQAFFIKELNKRGLNLTKNTWSNWGMRPILFAEIMCYQQYKFLPRYQGEKTHQLAFAINWLSYYAGKYDRFIDLFGGGANATINLIKNDTTQYYINELDKSIVCYYKVMQNKDDVQAIVNYFVNIQSELIKQRAAIKEQNKRLREKEEIEILGNYLLTEWEDAYRILENTKQYSNVEVARSFIFLRSMAFNNITISKSGVKDIDNIRNFIEYNIPGGLEELSKRFRRIDKIINEDVCNIENGTFVNKYCNLGGKKCLIYSDSPYESSKGYDVIFSKENMNFLINMLYYSNHKFIFSCRASAYISNQSSKLWNEFVDARDSYNIDWFNEIGEGAYEEPDNFEAFKLWRANTNIFFNVFEIFFELSKNKNNLYVLCIIPLDNKKIVKNMGKVTLLDCIESHWMCEIMITNYDFPKPNDYIRQTDNHIFVFEKYNYNDFYNILKSNMFKGGVPLSKEQELREK